MFFPAVPLAAEQPAQPFFSHVHNIAKHDLVLSRLAVHPPAWITCARMDVSKNLVFDYPLKIFREKSRLIKI
jgi:hypothetical protein